MQVTRIQNRPYEHLRENSPRIPPFLWFDSNAEEAVEFYVGIFQNSRRLVELHSAAQTTVPKGSILTIDFELPAPLPRLLRNPNAMQAVMKMKKLDIAELERAAKSEAG